MLLISGPCYGPEYSFLESHVFGVFCVLGVMLLIWVRHDRSSEMAIPRYFADKTFASSVSRRKYLVSKGVLRRVACRT